MMKKLIYIVPLLILTLGFNLESTETQSSESYTSFGEYIQADTDTSKGGFIKAASYSQTCYKSGERTSGMSKVCYYSCTCGTKALNKKATELCPLSAKFNC